MRLTKYILKTVLAVSSAMLALNSCKDEDTGMAEAVLASDTYISFAAQDAPSHTITVYSDGEWRVDGPSWVTVDPARGVGTVEGVTISVSDNVEGGVMGLPRRDTVKFHGNLLRSYSNVIVYQDGDKYNGAPTVKISGIAGVAEGGYLKVTDAVVYAVNKTGCVLSDGKTFLYFDNFAGVSVGDVISFHGCRSTSGGFPSVSDIEDLTVTGAEEVSLPEPVDLTSSIESYTVDSIRFASLDGVLKNGVITVGDASRTATLLNPTSDIDLEAVNGHRIHVEGFVVALAGGDYSIVASVVEDKGLDVVVSLLAKWHLGTGINATTATWAADGLDAVEGSGKITYVPYDLENSNANNKYKLDIQANNPRVTGPWPGDYWLFDVPSSISAGESVSISFESRVSATGHKFWRLEYLDGSDWKVAGNALTTAEPGYEITYTHAMNSDGSTNIQVSAEVTYSQTTTSCQFRFLCVANWSADGKGTVLSARNGGSARLSITDDSDETWQPTIRKISAAGLRKVYFQDDFSWMAPYTAATSAGDAVGTDDPGTTAPNVFSTAALAEAFVPDFTARGYTFIWGPDSEGGWGTEIPSGDFRTLYLQKDYLKFGKTSYNGGIKMSVLSGIEGTADISIDFDWCWQVTGAYKPDLMTLTLVAENGGTFADTGKSESGEIESGQSTEDGASHLAWQHATVVLKGATPQTVITIRPTEADPVTSNPARKQNRWYLDNILIQDAEE